MFGYKKNSEEGTSPGLCRLLQALAVMSLALVLCGIGSYQRFLNSGNT